MLAELERVKLREVLQRERARLLRNAQEGLSRSMERDQDVVGRDSIDESTAENMIATELRLRDREKWLLVKIDKALERLAAGTIDECEDCGEPIGSRRLLARPVTTLCIDCKESREREELALDAGGGRGLLGPGLGEDLEDAGAAEE